MKAKTEFTHKGKKYRKGQELPDDVAKWASAKVRNYCDKPVNPVARPAVRRTTRSTSADNSSG